MIKFELPIKTGAGLNDRGHWRARARKAKHERNTLCRVARSYLWQTPIKLPAVVTMVRHGAGVMDHDNLQGGLKSCRDGIADALGINDGSAQVEWRYAQVKCKRGQYLVVVTIESRTE